MYSNSNYYALECAILEKEELELYVMLGRETGELVIPI